MSLVDYAASSDEEDEPPQSPTDDQVKQNPPERPRFEGPSSAAPPNHPPLNNNNSHNRASAKMGPPSNKQKETVSDQSSETKLPDASFLLNSPVMPSDQLSDHSSRVAAAMAESAARKRDLNGSPATYPRSKIPKGNNLPHPKSVPDTVGGLLLPPQLTGRSNVVTEDINKLFVRKQTSSPTD